MTDYTALKQQIVSTSAALTAVGTGITGLLAGSDAALPFCIGGVIGKVHCAPTASLTGSRASCRSGWRCSHSDTLSPCAACIHCFMDKLLAFGDKLKNVVVDIDLHQCQQWGGRMRCQMGRRILDRGRGWRGGFWR